MNLYQILHQTWTCSLRNYLDDSEGFGNDTMSAVQIKMLHKCFKGGQESVESDPHSRRPATSRIPENAELVWVAINKEWWLTERELEANLYIWKTTVSEILMASAMGNWWLAASSDVPTYVSHLVQSFLAKHQVTKVTQPLYSPDLVPCDFWLFPKLKSLSKGKRFQSQWDSGKYDEANDGDSNKVFCRVLWTVEETLRELCDVLVTIFQGTEASESCVQCFIYVCMCVYIYSFKVNPYIILNTHTQT